MKKIIIFFLATYCSAAIAANKWDHVICKGTDTTGRAVTFAAYYGSTIVNINGDNLRIVGKTRDNSGVVTENFISTSGTLVYDSIVPVTDYSINIYQFNAVTERLLAKAYLTCTFFGSDKLQARISDHVIFNGKT